MSLDDETRGGGGGDVDSMRAVLIGKVRAGKFDEGLALAQKILDSNAGDAHHLTRDLFSLLREKVSLDATRGRRDEEASSSSSDESDESDDDESDVEEDETSTVSSSDEDEDEDGDDSEDDSDSEASDGVALPSRAPRRRVLRLVAPERSQLSMSEEERKQLKQRLAAEIKTLSSRLSPSK